MRLGQILVRRKLLTRSQLDELLSIQAISPAKLLGTLALEIYHLDREELDKALFEQRCRARGQWLIS